mmetsp:Transcript_27219/g.59953  ORF Transcript_27219/g.59953 Transcript_27219/m.59953 type:complete len:531 (-) Transcript_27219:931-2523(-)|eukprot:CAMPEP_0168177652 /NCGR_PEP_ID=MMETSP0139_2-20121125/8594_1 /TAXON_ID=44445 /ORGANISM="Pseudo-nitzschia australis, Strain 10249 10 AB" /LENGTH=530 /DNA_ID=CAMNT_0008096769 /DNA_START=171 /DNA_END=1763 /DNA_ORIENTATION=+
MSIPAVLYDHVPVLKDASSDNNGDEKTKEPAAAGIVSYFVSSIVHRVSTPQEYECQCQCDGIESGGADVDLGASISVNESDNQKKDLPGYTIHQEDDEGSNNTSHVEINNANNDSIGNHDHDYDSTYTNNIDTNGNNFNENQVVTEDDEDGDDCPLETIIEDIDCDYVLIPIPPPSGTCTAASDDNCNHEMLAAVPQQHQQHTGTGTNKILKALLKATRGLAKRNRRRIASFWEADGCRVGQKHGALQTSSTTLLLESIQSYARDLSFFSIYSSYDWVSETIVDASGNRLILPGACISLDMDSSSQNCVVDGDTITSGGNNHSAGALIVPEYADTQKDNTAASRIISAGLPPPSTSSSMWGSNTIMVSAHDLLAVKRPVKRDQPNQQQGVLLYDPIQEEELASGSLDFQYFYRGDENDLDHSTIMAATTQNATQQWKRALLKLTQRKANVLSHCSHVFVRQSIRETGRLLIKSQQLLIKYCKSIDRHNYRRLILLRSKNEILADCDGGNDGKGDDQQDQQAIAIEMTCNN